MELVHPPRVNAPIFDPKKNGQMASFTEVVQNFQPINFQGVFVAYMLVSGRVEIYRKSILFFSLGAFRGCFFGVVRVSSIGYFKPYEVDN